MPAAPTTLDCLYRFTRYNEEDGPDWSVASCPIGMDKRLYRIMYQGEEAYEQELTIDIASYKTELRGYKHLLEVISHDGEFCKEFRLACQELMQVDPWLQSL